MGFEEWFDDNRQELSLVFEEREEGIDGVDWEDFLIDQYEDYLFEQQEQQEG